MSSLIPFIQGMQIAPTPVSIDLIYLDDEGRDNIIGLTPVVSGGISPYTYLWTDLESDTSFVTGTGGTLPASSTAGDSNTSTETIGWHSTVGTAIGPNFDVRLEVTDAVGQTASLDFVVVDDAPNYIQVTEVDTVDYDEEKTYTLPSGNYTYSWTLPESARLTGGSISSNTVTITWDNYAWLEDREEDLVVTMTADPANPQAVYSIITTQTTISGVVSSQTSRLKVKLLDDFITESGGVLTGATDLSSNGFTLTVGGTPAWDGSKVTFDGSTDYVTISSGWNWDPEQVTFIAVADTTSSATFDYIMAHRDASNGYFIMHTTSPASSLQVSVSDQTSGQFFSAVTTGSQGMIVGLAEFDFPGGDGEVRITDADSTSTGAKTFPGGYTFHSDIFTIGAATSNGGSSYGFYFPGDIYEVWVFDGILTSQEITDAIARLKTHYSIT